MSNRNLFLAAGGAPSGPVDPNFNQTTLLLHGDGTNGAQNNTFLDSSTNNFTITRNGNTTQGTFSPFSLPNGEFSNFFDGSGDFLTAPDNAALELGSGDFTLEAWVYLTAYSGNYSGFFGANIIAKDASGARAYAFAITATASSYTGLSFLVFDAGGNANLSFAASATININTWNHVAVTRSGNSFYLFLNGSQIGTTTSSVSILDNATPTRIGAGGFSGFEYFLNGYMSNARLLKGTALYTAAFTPPTAPLTAIANTSLLTCQTNRFVDNSTNAFAITVNGNTSVQPFSPFLPSAAYDPSVNGGSGYFDGSGDYLSLSSNAAFQMGTGDFTYECWVYHTSVSGQQSYFSDQFGNTAGVYFYKDTSNFPGVYYSSQIATSSIAVTAGQWYHLVASRASGTLKIFVNGVQGASVSNTTNLTVQTQFIGGDTGSASMLGYISNARIVKGTAVYTAAFTPPTALLTAISGTSLLCNFTNAGIFDNTGKNNLETVGDAQIDTSVKKYGTGSMEFDGAGDYLALPNNENQQLGTGNFTIEFWVYLATGDTGSNRGLVAKGTSTTGFLVSLNTTEKVVFTFATSTITSTGAITLDAWNHIAVVREGTGSNETKIYIAGTNDGTGTVSTDFNQTSVMYVGANRTGGDPMKGYIDDLRITKGVARYTAAFTPPTEAFPDF